MSHVEIWGRSVPGSGNNANAKALWWEHAGLDVDCDMHQLHGQVVGEWVIECLKHLYLLPPAEGGEGVRDIYQQSRRSMVHDMVSAMRVSYNG